MSSDAPRRIINVRERGSSSDQTRIQDITHRMVQEGLYAMAAGDSIKGGVLTGLNVTTDASGRTATISPGIALIRDTGKSFPDSQWRWIEVTSDIVVAIAAATAADRFDVVEIAPATTVTINTGVDIFNTTTNVFVSEVKDKEVQSAPAVTIRTGAAGAEFLAGIADVIPLAYVFVQADGTVEDGIDGVVACRPILRSDAMSTVSESAMAATNVAARSWVQGGGLLCIANTVSIANSCQGRFAGSGVGFTVEFGAQRNTFTPDNWDSGNFGSDQACYLYAIPPPYPSGYVDIAARELEAGSALSSLLLPVGPNPGTVHGCVTILSTHAPTTSSPIGHGSGTATIKWRVAGTNYNSDRESWVYLGAFDYDAQPQDQTSVGPNVFPSERHPFYDQLTEGDGAYNVKLPNNDGTIPAFNGIFPTTATVIEGLWVSDLDDAADVYVRMFAITPNTIAFEHENASGGSREYRDQIRMKTSGSNTFVTTTSGTINVFGFLSTSYVDQILASR